MHVSHHLRLLSLQVHNAAQPHEARKKPDDDPDKVPPVKRRFSEDEQEAGRRRQRQGWRDQELRTPEEAAIARTVAEFEEAANAQGATTAPSVHVASLPVSSQLDALLAAIKSEASAGDPPSTGQTHKAAEPSLGELLAQVGIRPEKL